MSEELQVSEWDNFTPEQKHLLLVWIKSLEEAQAASIELIKSFNDQETTPEVTTTSNAGSLAPKFDSMFSERLLEPDSPPEIPPLVLLKICEAGCVLKSNGEREQCLEECRKKLGIM